MLAGLAVLVPIGEAQAAPPAPAKGAALANVDPGAASTAVRQVNGFRSAKFGMTETEVRSAIRADFGLSGDAVKLTPNVVEQTNVLSIKVPDLLPTGGAAEIGYVFGYKSKKLIQVNVAWSQTIDPKTTSDQLIATGEILRASFVDQGYKPDTVAMNKEIKSGILLFRGQDTGEHTTLLLLQGSTSAKKDKKAFEPSSLLLVYIADSKNPDVFKLAPGQF